MIREGFKNKNMNYCKFALRGGKFILYPKSMNVKFVLTLINMGGELLIIILFKFLNHSISGKKNALQFAKILFREELTKVCKQLAVSELEFDQNLIEKKSEVNVLLAEIYYENIR